MASPAQVAAIGTVRAAMPDQKSYREFQQAMAREGIFSGTHGSYWDADGNLYVQDWNVDGRIMKLVRVK